MMNFRNALLGATMLLAVPQIGHAQPVNGAYVAGGAGFNILQNEHIRASSLPVPISGVTANFQTGWAALGSVGWGFGNGLRLEFEGSYRTNHLRGRSGIIAQSSSTEDKVGAMMNALYDFNLGDVGVDGYGISPYLGVGAGWVQNKWNNTTIQDGPGQVRVNGSGNNIAIQGIVGVAYAIPAVPGLAVTAEYRVIGVPVGQKYSSVYTSGGASFASQTKARTDMSQSVLLGLRYALNTPAPVAAPVLAAVPPATVAAPQNLARSYLLFFDWDSAELSTRANQIILDAAQNAGRVRYTKIDVQGHADLTGPHPYNVGLSLRRANAVAVELVKDGVPEPAIVVTALGDTRPLVKTEPGVREPQNRRVEIIIN